MKKSGKVILIMVVLLLSVLLAGCSTKKQEEKTVVKIAYLPLTHALPLFEEKELLDNKADSNIEIELVKFGSWPDLLDAVSSGKVDGASMLIELAMKAKQNGIGIKAVALGHKDGNVIVVANDINSVADLKGKNFAVPSKLSSHNILLNEMLDENGMTTADVNVVEMAPAEMPAALANGQISGYCVAEPFGAKSVALGNGKVLYQSGDLWEDSLCCGLVLTDAFLDKKDIADAFISSYLEAGNNLSNDEAVKIGEKYLNQDKDVLALSLKWISFDDLKITNDMYQSLTDKMTKYGVGDGAPEFNDFVYQ